MQLYTYAVVGVNPGDPWQVNSTLQGQVMSSDHTSQFPPYFHSGLALSVEQVILSAV